MRERLSVAIHPLLFALFPVLFLFFNNIGELQFDEVFLPSLLIVTLTFLFWLLVSFFIKNWAKAALIVSLSLLGIFSYGHAYPTIESWRTPGWLIGTSEFALSLWGILLAGGTYLIIRTKKNLAKLTIVLNVTAVVLVILPMANIVYYELAERPQNITATGNEGTSKLSLENTGTMPDIYYIILDRYADLDTLKRVYNFDNSEFLQFLTNRGFYVTSDSHANYLKTHQSLASSLNMEYLNYLTDELGQDSGDQTGVLNMVQDYKIWRSLKAVGYNFVHVGSSWGPSIKNRYADVNINYFNLPMSYFSRSLYQTTMLYPFGAFIFDTHREQWERILYEFDRLAEIPDMKGPTFVFAHLLIPHDPYVFDRNGNFLTRGQASKRSRTENYVGQIVFLNKKVKVLLNHLIASSDTPPIILLQSDEGPFPLRYERDEIGFNWNGATDEELREKMGILNAYYLPGVDRGVLYPSITPVNSFRLIFNLYFKANLDLLPDESYVFRDQKHPYQFINVTDRLKHP